MKNIKSNVESINQLYPRKLKHSDKLDYRAAIYANEQMQFRATIKQYKNKLKLTIVAVLPAPSTADCIVCSIHNQSINRVSQSSRSTHAYNISSTLNASSTSTYGSSLRCSSLRTSGDLLVQGIEGVTAMTLLI